MSVSPRRVDIMAGEVVDDEHVGAGERIGLEAEDKFIRKLVDPKSPSKEDVEMHYLMGHIPYRNWCPICVKAFGK